MRWMRWSLTAMFTGIFLFSLSAPVRAERLVVMMDWILNGKHSPWFAGVKKGLYKAEGLDPEILRGRGSGNTVKAVATETSDYAFVGGAADGVEETVTQIVVRGVASHGAGATTCNAIDRFHSRTVIRSLIHD